MPTYLVTDAQGPTQIMVEAKTKASAIAHVVDDRFSAGDALSAPEAVKLLRKGVEFVDINNEPTLPLEPETPEPLQQQAA